MTTVTITPKILCRCCAVELEAKYQTPITASRPGFWYLTCFAEGCKLYGHTFTDNTYAAQDLSAYLKSASQSSIIQNAIIPGVTHHGTTSSISS